MTNDRLKITPLIILALTWILITVAAGRLHLMQIENQRERERRWQADWVRQGSARQQKVTQMRLLRRANSRSPEELAEKINDGKPFELTTNGSLESTTWYDAETQLTFTLIFRKGRWSDLYVKSWPKKPAKPIEPRMYRQMEQWRSSFVGWNSGWGPAVWFGLLVMFVVVRQCRHSLSLCLAVIGFSCYIGWLVSPDYNITVQGLFSNDMLVWGVGMLLISTVVFAATWHSRLSANRRFMQFRLQTLLIVVTIVAGLSAMGAYGFVVLITLTICFILSIITRAIAATSVQVGTTMGKPGGVV